MRIPNVDIARRLAPTTLMYHGTSSEFLRSILKHGLTPGSKEGRWVDEEVDLQASQNHSSVKSYGGVYFTTNFMIGYSSATNLIQKKEAHKGANPLIICAQIQPQSSLPDEDHYTSITRRFTRYIDESLFPNVLLGERTEALEKRADKGELHALAKEVIITEIERQYAHISKKVYKSYDTSEHKLRKILSIFEPKKTWFGAEGETVEPLPKEVEPKTVKQAEVDHRNAMDAFIRKTKNITKAELSENANRTNLRLMDPVTFSGRNRIIAIIEIDRYHKDDSEDRIVIHYGTMPEKFKSDYMEGIGKLPPIVKHGRLDTSSSIDTAATKPDFEYLETDGMFTLLPNTKQAEKIYSQIVAKLGPGKLLPQQFESVRASLRKAGYTLQKAKKTSSKGDEDLLKELGIDTSDFLDIAADYYFYKYGGDRGVALSITKGGETRNYAIRKGDVFGVKPSVKGPTFSSLITKTLGDRTVFTVTTTELRRLLNASKKYSPENVNKVTTPSHLSLMHEEWKSAPPRLRTGRYAHLYAFTKWANIHTNINIDVHDIFEALQYRQNKGLDQERLKDNSYILSVNRGIKAFKQLFGQDLVDEDIADLAKWIVNPRSKPTSLAESLMASHDKRWKVKGSSYVKIH